MQNQVTFAQLSPALKTIVIISWIIAGLFTLSFMIGFIQGLLLA